MRDGTPLPGRTPAQLVSQLAHRVLGPLRPHRIRAVLDYHGLRGAPATAGQAEIAATYGVHVQSVSNWVATVAANGRHLPMSLEMATQISRRSRPDEDHRGRTRVAHTFGFPPPARPPAPGPAPQPRIPPQQWAAAGIAVRVRSPRSARSPCPACSTQSSGHDDSEPRAPMTTDELADGLLAVHATLADGLWHAPAGATAPDRYRLVADALGACD